MGGLVIGVDVGTASARAGVFDRKGHLLGRAEHPLEIGRPDPTHAEYQSEQIWEAVASAVRGAVSAAGVSGEDISGIGFDATCSLVVRDRQGLPLGVSTTGEDRWDTIVWMDHRALAEAQECTDTGHRVLGSVGGVMSPEMEIPKLMWLKRHFPQRWERAGFFFDLADFLTWKASGSTGRSQCTLTCKWTYLAHEPTGWQGDFLETVGLGDLLARGALPERATPIGQDLGFLTEAAAAALGLTTRCRVGAGLIDAHAGALGALGGTCGKPGIERHLALIAGTSSCLMALSADPHPTHGVWGPYFGAVLPGLWLNEGGQSVTGALLDHVIALHGAGGRPGAEMHRAICARVAELRQIEGPAFAARLHVLPDFHGNRSPLADPGALGVISGLDLDRSFDSLCRLYWRTAVGIALGVRHILDALNAQGHAIDTLHVTGGHIKNPLLMELYADATGCTLVQPQTEDAVLLGTAMVAATAAGLFPDLAAATKGMEAASIPRAPNPQAFERFTRDYRVFLMMHEHRQAIDRLR
ncbi:ribulokinase [Rhodospirillum rubrum]|uniref:FGGY-family carbohydrate kinase n=1 Tax=Rhodospirillum rubrum TaxID=1085 RepID=UPI0019087410|nr:FGGY-family carbohydrate kinase [Rhodospirillum rubrum]MBK1662964.1 ribulokinase [Rhodospirillum rubrum]MBK1675251.1 ribulokinase [Rhodospirillum rubrum]